MDTPQRKPGLLAKSPSVPDFHGSTRVRNINFDMKRNASPMLPSWSPPQDNSPQEHPSRLRVESTYIDDDGSLSFIDLYGDEMMSRKTNINDDDDDDYIPINDECIDDPSGSRIYSKSTVDTFSDSNPDFTTESSTRTESENFESLVETVNHFVPTEPKILIDPNGIYDRYGFKKQSNAVSEMEYNSWWKEYAPYCHRRKLKWKIFLEKHKIQPQRSQAIPTRFPDRTEKLKRYVRKGIPGDWRGNAWWYFAKGDDLLKKNVGKYKSLVGQVEILIHSQNDEKYNKIYMDMEIIERDLNRTFPDNLYFQHNPDSSKEPGMISALRRILVAFSIYNPKIGYCQSMNFLAGLLLLFLEEEKAFWMLVIITSKYLPGVHDINLEGVNIDQGVLMLCIREYLPGIWKTIESTCETTALHNTIQSKKTQFKNEFLFKLPPITLSTVSWFMSCFIGIVPVETTLRIWDCLFYEGSHFLFKISLTIFKICEHELMRKRHQSRIPGISTPNLSKNSKSDGEDEDIELFQLVQALPKKLLDPNDLFEKSIFKRIVNFNSLGQDDIDRCRKYVMNQRIRYKEFVDMMNRKQNEKGPYINGTTAEKSTGSSRYDVSVSSSEESITSAKDLSDVLMHETYGFKRTLTNVSWNNIGLKSRVRQIGKKKGR